MKKGEKIIVIRVANGYAIMPENGRTIADESVLVFQDMGYANAARDNQKTEETLLGFIVDHFSRD